MALSPYAQKQGANPHPAHWQGKPPGTSYTGSGCWCCAKGCAILCVLKLKGSAPNEANIKAYLNASADVKWADAGLSKSATIVAPSVGKVSGKDHYCHIAGMNKDGSFAVFDPDGGQSCTKQASYFEYCYK
jgi:hypothetical protein